MIRILSLGLIAGLIVPAFAEETEKKGPQLEVAWSITEGLDHPESAYFDADSGFLFLSQIGGGGGKAKDGDGWISKLTTDGKMVENKWVTGFNAPKGLRSFGGTLYVSDIDRIVAVDIEKGEISKEIPIEGAVFLNDLCTGPDGTVYVSDMAESKIYQYKGGEVSVFIEGEELEHPNGVLVHRNQLILGGWGSGFNKENFSTKELGKLRKVNLKTKEITVVTPEPTAHLDGIEFDGAGGFLVTDWRNGKLFRINRKGKARLLMNFPQGAADHAYLIDKGWIILPEMLEGKLTAFKYQPPARRKKNS